MLKIGTLLAAMALLFVASLTLAIILLVSLCRAARLGLPYMLHRVSLAKRPPYRLALLPPPDTGRIA